MSETRQESAKRDEEEAAVKVLTDVFMEHEKAWGNAVGYTLAEAFMWGLDGCERGMNHVAIARNCGVIQEEGEHPADFVNRWHTAFIKKYGREAFDLYQEIEMETFKRLSLLDGEDFDV